MKKLTMLIFALLAAVTASMAQDTALNMEMRNGGKHSFLLSDKPLVTLSGSQLVITTSNQVKATFTLHDVRQYSFGAPTGITAPGTTASYERQGDVLVFRGVADKTQVAVYTLGGVRVAAPLSSVADGVSLSLSDLSAGAYIVKTPSVTFKITK